MQFKNTSDVTLNSITLAEAGVPEGTVAPGAVVEIADDLAYVVSAVGITGLVPFAEPAPVDKGKGK